MKNFKYFLLFDGHLYEKIQKDSHKLTENIYFWSIQTSKIHTKILRFNLSTKALRTSEQDKIKIMKLITQEI